MKETLENPANPRENGWLSQARTEVIGGKQLGFSDDELTTAKKQTKRETFLFEMEALVPWQALIALIEPLLPQSEQEGWSASLSIGHHAPDSPASAVDLAQRSSDGRGLDRISPSVTCWKSTINVPAALTNLFLAPRILRVTA